MATLSEPLMIGQAMVVHGTVRAVSTDGVTQLIQPNNPIHLDDRIDTGSDGAISIVFNDADNTQLDLNRMTDMIIDQDVLGNDLSDLSDVTAESRMIQDLLENWQVFEPVVPLDTLATEPVGESSVADAPADMETPVSLDAGSASTELASVDSGDDGIGSMDDDLDLANLIPPPDDAA